MERYVRAVLTHIETVFLTTDGCYFFAFKRHEYSRTPELAFPSPVHTYILELALLVLQIMYSVLNRERLFWVFAAT